MSNANSNHNQQSLIALVKAGLWEKEVRLLPYNDIDYSQVLRIAEEQSVVGIVTAGLEHVQDIVVPQIVKLLFVGKSMQIEQTNLAMNQFIADAVFKMNEAGINSVLVKGQGIAQCYERPLWRASGDVDFFFSKDEYDKAVVSFQKLNKASVVQNARYTKSFGVVIEPWFVELHGTLRNGLSSRMDREIDEVQEDTFRNGQFRIWRDGNTEVFLPEANNDVFLVFVHFVRHFYKERATLRQLCDWCRLLWTYRENFDAELLAKRLRNAGLMSEWKAFAALVVGWIGMPSEVMPLYEDDKRWHKKGEKILNYILNSNKSNKIQRTSAIAKIFSCNTIKFIPSIFFNVNGLKIKERLLSA